MKTLKFCAIAFCLSSASLFGQSDKPCSFTNIDSMVVVLNDELDTEGFNLTRLYVGYNTPETSEYGLVFNLDEGNVFDVSNMTRFDFVTSDDMLYNGFIQVVMFQVARSRDGKEGHIVDEKLVCESRGQDVLVNIDQFLNK